MNQSTLRLICRGDELNIVHVIERSAPPVEHHGAPPVDYLPQPAPTPHEQVVETAKQFLQARFGTKVQALQPPPVVHLVTVRSCHPAVGMRCMLPPASIVMLTMTIIK